MSAAETSGWLSPSRALACGLLVCLALGAAVGVSSFQRSQARVRAEGDAIGALRYLGSAQTRFRDLKGRYASLSELSSAGLIDANFAERSGYRLGVRASEWKWLATATPIHSGSELRYFAATHTGVIEQRTTAPFPLREDCELEAEARCACGLLPGTPH